MNSIGPKSHNLDMWCTLKEYKKIKPWAREVTLRWLQLRAKENMLPDPIRKTAHPTSRRLMFFINITDPKDLIALRSYREVKEYQKTHKPPKPKTSVHNQKRLFFHIPTGTPYELVMKSKQHRDVFLCQLEAMAESLLKNKAHVPAVDRSRYSLMLSYNTHKYIDNYAKELGLSANAVLVMLFVEFCQSNHNRNLLQHAAETAMSSIDRPSEPFTYPASV